MLRYEAHASDSLDDRKPPAISDYELIRPIGRGAYGEVWLARGVTGLLRAVKIVRRNTFGSAEPFEREFRGLKEFAAISLVAHNQLALLHVGQNQEAGFFYYVMELADDLSTGRAIDVENYVPCTLSALQKKKGRLTTDEAVTIGVELARGLASLHAHGLIHRDIKPANIIFVGGTPKLADIGLVTAADLGRSIIGTEGFIAPEGPGTSAADVYSAGKVLYELNTGLDRKAFPVLPHNENEAVNHRRFLDLNEIVLRACAADAARRYPNAEALLRDLMSLQSGRGLLGKRVVRWLSPIFFRVVVALMVIAVAAVGAWIWPKISPPRPRIAHEPASQKSLAVLPFDNLSADPAFAFFASGMHEDVILRLAKIRDLNVISRTSVVAYKPGARNLKEIATELGVANILEGTVRREGTRVRVTVRLIAGQADNPIWAETYERDLTDAFAIQSALSQEIAGVLHAKLTDNERRLISRRATADPEAYDQFLQARDLFQQLASYGGRQYEKVIELCEAAIARDPNFAAAYVQLSLAHSYLFRFSEGDTSPAQLARATRAATMAMQLDPSLPEARLARGVVHYLGDRDWAGALREFRAAERDLPNDEQLQWWTGNVLRRLGRWDDAVGYFLSSMRLNPTPRAPLASVTAIQTMRYLRRFTEARDLAKLQLRRFPEYRQLQAEFARCQVELDGDIVTFLDRMDNLSPGNDTPDFWVVHRKYESAFRRGDWNTAETVLSDARLTQIIEPPGYVPTPVALHRAQVAFLANRVADVGVHAKQALAEYEGGIWSIRQQPWRMIGKARTYALLGRGADAVKQANLAWEAVANADAFDAAVMLTKVAEVHILLGNLDEALEVLQRMVARPSDIGPQAIRADPLWQKVTLDPRVAESLRAFRKL